ncbi:MAG: hypothetical protein HC940_09425, partial [Acaryochloris sp. SU_5_25]|nr:hypothetical protein [Acaryochloris sp. SU_5_25]
TPPMHPQRMTPDDTTPSEVVSLFAEHPQWNQGNGWKNWLNNLCLILLPCVTANLLKPWLNIFPIPPLEQGFKMLIQLMNQFQKISVPLAQLTLQVFSSA